MIYYTQEYPEVFRVLGKSIEFESKLFERMVPEKTGAEKEK